MKKMTKLVRLAVITIAQLHDIEKELDIKFKSIDEIVRYLLLQRVINK